MKTAQGKYHFANNEIFLNLYFDPKCFSCILPPLDAKEQDQLRRQVCDSIAIAMPKEVPEKRFYIKRAFRPPHSNYLTLFCTDGFLMDSTLVIPLHEQPFQTERIKITEIDQLPTRFKLNNEADKIMQANLAVFEENAKKVFATEYPTAQKEPTKNLKAFDFAPAALDKASDIFSEIHSLKKEIIEMSNSRQESLTQLMNQVEMKRKRIDDLVMQEANTDLRYDENKRKLQEYAEQSISKYCSEFIKETNALKQKLDLIILIPTQFENETHEACLLITQQIHHINKFKELLIQELFASAQEYSAKLSKEWQQISGQGKIIAINEFNRKFHHIACLSESGELNDYQITLDRLIPLSLENLQDLISSEHKDHLGLLQKCNTSWTEESIELKIVMQHLTKLNKIYRNFFQQDPLYAQYATSDMIQIIRIPFPRSFQFKFSLQAFEYKKSLEQFCKSQKEIMSFAAQTNKKTMQIEDTLHKTKLAMIDAEKVSDSIRLTVASYKTLLQRKEESGEIIKLATKEYAEVEQIVNTVQQLQLSLSNSIVNTMKNLRRKIEGLIAELEAYALEAHKEMQKMNDIKIQIDLIIKDADTQAVIQDSMKKIETHTKTMQISVERLQEINIMIHDFASTLNRYQEALNDNQQLLAYTSETIRKQQQEAKRLVSKIIHQTSSYGNISENRKKQMVDLFSQIDTSVSQIERRHKEALDMQNQLFEQLNNKRSDLSNEAFDNALLSLKTKIADIETKKNQIANHLEEIKSLA